MNHHITLGSRVFGNWVVTRAIGEGSYGKVFEIIREDFGTTYHAALKIITIPQSEAELQSYQRDGIDIYTVVEAIVGEFALMSKLKGTNNIVSYEDHQVIPHPNGVGWSILIRMELLTPVLSYAYQHPFSRKEIIQLGIDLCRALELCQKYNIIHRDIKPDNIFVSDNGDFKLGDFGIARTIDKTMSGLSKKGTFPYMAPEVYKGESYGFSVDICSLGLVLYRLLNKNRMPFLPESPKPITFHDNEHALAQRMSGEKIPLPFYHEGRLPEIILKACAYDPKERYASPLQMRQELESILYDSDDATTIYPDGDCLEIQANQYAASRQANASYEESDATASIFHWESSDRDHEQDTSRTTGLFSTASAQSAQDYNHTQSIFGTSSQPVAKQKKHQKTKSETKPLESKKKLLIGASVACLILIAGLLVTNQAKNAAAAEAAAAAAQIARQESQFLDLLTEAESLSETDPELAIEKYKDALALQPNNPIPAVGTAYAQYLSREYTTCITYIEDELALGKSYDISVQSQLAAILGACYYEQQDYAAAASFFRLSTAGGDLTASAMRDYAVSLGRLGDIDAADEVLQTMFDAGATQIETAYVQAEVDYAKESYLDAEMGFKAVLEQSDDTALQIRAMRSLAEVYRDCAVLERTGQSPISGAAMQEAELLADGIDTYGLRHDSTLWEMLALAYFETYHVTPDLDESWLTRSADAFNLVIELGIQKEYLYTNLYSIYYELGDYTAAETALVEYEAVYPNSYTPHALRATMLIMIENQKSQDNRNYHAAYDEFLVAESKLHSSDDRTYYQQVKSLVDTLFSQGWL